MLSFSGTYGIGGHLRKAIFSHLQSLRPSGTAFARLIVCRLGRSLGVDTISFLKEDCGGSSLKFGSYVVHVRRNRTVGSNFDVTSHSCLVGVLRRRLQTVLDFRISKM
jgi:hypothetical protein